MITRKRRDLVIRIGWALASAAMALATTIPAGAQGPDAVEDAGRLRLQMPGGTLTGSAPSGWLIMSPGTRRALNIVELTTRRSLVRLIDLDRLEVIRELAIPQRVAGPPSPRSEWAHAIDAQGNRFFLSYAEGGLWRGVLSVDGGALERGRPAEEVVRVFPALEATDPTSFVGVDPGDQSDPVTVCTASNCLPAVAGTPGAVLFGMDYVPPELTGRPKLLLLLQDVGVIPAAERNNSNVWVAQWDPETGHQDWIYRVAACSQSELPRTVFSTYQVELFQSRSRGDGIIVGCQSPGGTGQSVLLTVDSTNRPVQEVAYPGPLDVSDIIADRDGDRLLFRVKPAAAGESWWAFDARSLSYAGVVGVTVTGAAASAGVDPTSGRLYVVAPKAQSGGQRSGGLYISDIRRSPPPQALVFEEFAGTGTGRIGVDVHPGTGERRIFVPEADHCGPGALCTYRILRDSVPVSADPPMEDQDRLTTDAEEREGVTGATFAGTGHTYGLRALIVGGLEGVPPGGPAVTEIRPGRYGIMRLGSPCQKGDREIVLGKVRNVALSNELAAASAIAGDTDPGTKIDLEQPSARCYPIPPDAARVLQSQGQSWPRPVDPPADSPDGRNDIDREVGRTWPFGPAECAGDGSASRDKTGLGAVEVEGFRASVECKQASGRASARAEARGGETPAFEAEGLPGIGSVRVGEVSGSVQIYRDRARGLVARTTATARGISIGDVISIDAALTISEAWAGGRPGTADTAFVRRLCGVRIPSQDVDLSAVQEVQGNVEAMLREQGVHPPPADLPRTDDVDACGDPGIPVLSPTLVAQFGSPPLVGAMNRALGARGRASAPPPDRALAQGTPGGYLASVQKDRLEQESSRAINNDVTTQVPALELAIYNDDPAFGRGRQIFQFAGTDASVTYGIYLLAGIDTPDEFVDDFDLPEILIDMTGGSDFVQEPPPSGAVRRPRSPFRMLFSGVAFLIRSPRQALLAGVVWAALFSPVALGLRRRSLREVLES